MAKSIDSGVLDAALDEIATGNALAVCSTEPTTRAQALTSYALATVAMTTGDGNGSYVVGIGDAAGDSRKVRCTATANITVTATGTAQHVAIVDATTLHVVTTCTSQVLSATGNTVTVPAFDIEFAAPT